MPQYKDMEKKIKSLEAEMTQMREDLSAAERGRRAAERGRHAAEADLQSTMDMNNKLKKEVKELQRDAEEAHQAKSEVMQQCKGLKEELQATEDQKMRLEVNMQATEDQKMRLEVNMQALKTQYERDLAAKEEDGEEKRRGMSKQIRDLEAELDEERKQKVAAINAKKAAKEWAAFAPHAEISDLVDAFRRIRTRLRVDVEDGPMAVSEVSFSFLFYSHSIMKLFCCSKLHSIQTRRNSYNRCMYETLSFCAAVTFL